MEAPDKVLVDRMAAGDDDALGEVFDRYAPVLAAIARRVTHSVQIAEDVVQEVLAGLWCNPERFDSSRGTLRAYLGVQAHRRAVDALRSEVRRRAREERTEVIDITEEPTAASDMAQVVREAIARLPEDQRRAVELAFWHGHTYREVATVLHIPEGTAKSRLRLAQAKLSEWLGPLALEMA